MAAPASSSSSANRPAVPVDSAGLGLNSPPSLVPPSAPASPSLPLATLQISFRRSRFNPFVNIREAVVKSQGEEGINLSHRFSSRMHALAWTIIGAVWLPFVLIGSAFQVMYGGLTMVVGACCFYSGGVETGKEEVMTALKNVRGLAGSIFLSALAVPFSELIMHEKLALYDKDQYFFIPWCGHPESILVPVPVTKDPLQPKEHAGFRITTYLDRVEIGPLEEENANLGIANTRPPVVFMQDGGPSQEVYNRWRQPYLIHVKRS